MENVVTIIVVVTGILWMTLLLSAFFGKMFKTVSRTVSRHWKASRNRIVIADAVVLKAEHTGWRMDRTSTWKLLMQVKPGTGRNFIAETRCCLAGAVKEGAILRVQYNPKNFRHIILVQAA